MAAAPGITRRIPLPYGPLGAFLPDPLGFQLQARERFGDVFRFRILTVRPGLVVKPAASLGLWPDGPVWLTVNRQE